MPQLLTVALWPAVAVQFCEGRHRPWQDPAGDGGVADKPAHADL